MNFIKSILVKCITFFNTVLENASARLQNAETTFQKAVGFFAFVGTVVAGSLIAMSVWLFAITVVSVIATLLCFPAAVVFLLEIVVAVAMLLIFSDAQDEVMRDRFEANRAACFAARRPL